MTDNQIHFLPMLPPHSHLHLPMPRASQTLRALARNGLTSVHETFFHITNCLNDVKDVPATYRGVASDINLLCNWSWLIQKKDIIELTVVDINAFIDFANNPPKHLIGKYGASLIDQKKSDQEYIEENPDWRPFVNTQERKPYKRTESSLKAQLSNLSYVFTYFADIEYAEKNPAAIALRRLTSNVLKSLKTNRNDIDHKGLNSVQVKALFEAVEAMAMNDPTRHERTRFLIHLMVFCYPRISEVSARAGYSPIMSDFQQHRTFDGAGVYHTFYIPVSKAGKSRQVVCDQNVIDALTRYRRFLGLTDFPDMDDESPLFVRHRAATRGREASIVDANLGSDQILSLIKSVYEAAAELLLRNGLAVEAQQIVRFGAHALRHTGISLDLNSGRDKRHVMLDAGHSSESTLTIYTSKRTEDRAAGVAKKTDYFRQIEDMDFPAP